MVIRRVNGELETITGLELSIDGDYLVEGKRTKDLENEDIEEGSNDARAYLRHLIKHDESLELKGNKLVDTQGLGGNSINLNLNQIESNINSLDKVGLNPLAYGYGMIFLHETLHTDIGVGYYGHEADFYDHITDGSGLSSNKKGNAVKQINVFRSDLGLATRESYL